MYKTCHISVLIFHDSTFFSISSLKVNSKVREIMSNSEIYH